MSHPLFRLTLVGLLFVVVARLLGWPPMPSPLANGELRERGARLLEGQVDGPVRRLGDGYRVRLAGARFREDDGWRTVAGAVWLKLPPRVPLIGVGMRLRAWALLTPLRRRPNPGVRDPAAMLLDRGVTLLARAQKLVVEGEPGRIPRIRRRFRRWCESRLHSDASGIAQAIVLGDRGALAPARVQAWRHAGLAHVLAISGLHVGFVAWSAFSIVALVLGSVPAWASRRPVFGPAAIAALVAGWTWVAIAGAPVSAVRAAWMITGLVIPHLLGRGRDRLSAFCIAVLLVVVADPPALLDPACQMSFAAVAALFYGYSGPLRIGHLPPVLRWIAGIGIASALCTLATLPFVMWHFRMAPLAALFANVVALPLAAWGLVIPGVISLWLVNLGVPAPAAWLQVGGDLFQVLAEHCAELLPPLQTPGLQLGEILCVAAGAWLLIALVGARRCRAGSVALACALLIAPSVARLLDRAPETLRVTFLEIGHGSAILIQAPDGETLLVDGGGDPMERTDPGARVVVPAMVALGVRGLDAIALTHPDPDHYLGLLSVVEAMPPREWWTSGEESRAAPFRRLKASLESSGVRIRTLRRGDRLHLGQVLVEVLHPGGPDPDRSTNDGSLVLRLSLGRFSVLLPGDVEMDGEAALLASGQDLGATVLNVPHHGSRTSSSAELLLAVGPSLAVAQAADGGRFPFPRPEIEGRYSGLGIPLWVTGRRGAIQIESDGVSWWTRSW